MKKLLIVSTLMTALAVTAQTSTALPADEQLVLERYRIARAQREAFQALQKCEDTNVLAKVSAQMKAATSIKSTNSPTINRKAAPAISTSPSAATPTQ